LADPRVVRSVAPEGPIDRESFDLWPLPHDAAEAQRVARFGGRGTRVYVGPEATESRLKTSPLERFDVVHFATHGLLSRRVPSRSALLLAGDRGEEGLLTARRIYRLMLRSEMVVLSGCETARGRILAGEGVQGLAQAFFHAGARSVVASLWDVSDRRTADLMAGFYGHLAKGEAKAEALPSAKLDLLRHRPAPPPRPRG